jgi:hypothetical protein
MREVLTILKPRPVAFFVGLLFGRRLPILYRKDRVRGPRQR